MVIGLVLNCGNVALASVRRNSHRSAVRHSSGMRQSRNEYMIGLHRSAVKHSSGMRPGAQAHGRTGASAGAQAHRRTGAEVRQYRFALAVRR